MPTFVWGQDPGDIDEYIDASGLLPVDQALLVHNNLSDVENATLARANIGAMYGPNNLSEITDQNQARLNLGITSSSGTMSGYGWDIIESGNWDDLNFNYPASGYDDQIAYVKQQKKILFNTITTKQDGLYLSDGSTWNKSNLQVQFFDDSLEFRDDLDPSKGMKFQLGDLAPSGLITLNVPAESGTIARIEDLSSLPAPTGALAVYSNLSDVQSATTSRTNLGLGNSAVADFGITSDTVASGDHLHGIYQPTSEKGNASGYAELNSDGYVPSGQLPSNIFSAIGGSGDMLSTNNLSDVASIVTSRTNLGLGDSATKNVGITSETVASGDHLHNHSDTLGLQWSESAHIIDSGVDFNSNSASGIKSTQFDTSYVVTGVEPVGTSYWDSDNGTFSDVLENGVIGQRYMEAFTDGQNDTGVVIEDGTPVEYVGSIGMSGNFRITPAKATSTKPVFYFLGIATHSVANGLSGKITTRGKVRGIQTNGVNYGEVWTSGDIVYVSGTTAGHLTNVMPEAPIPAIRAALVISAHASNGTLEVKPSFPERLSELADVNGTTLDTNGQLTIWDNDNKYFDFTDNINNYQLTSEKSQPSGYASLGADGLVPNDQLPTSIGASGDMISTNNLFDVADVATARTNLGLGDSATKNIGITSDTVASGDHLHSIYQETSEKGVASGYPELNSDGYVPSGQLPSNIFSISSSGDMLSANNLSDLADAPTARTNLGLGTAAVANFGITSDTVASGDHLHSIYQETSEKGVASGYPELNSDGYVPSGQLPSNIFDAGTGDMLSTNNLSDVASVPTSRTNLGVAKDFISGEIDAASDKKYTLDYSARYPYSVNNIHIASSGGSCSAAFYIGSSGITNLSSIAVSTSDNSATATGNNYVSIGENFNFIISSNSAALGVVFTAEIERL